VKVFLFHCWGGDGRSCWSGWLSDQLLVSGLASRVSSPDFPETQNPKLETWLGTARGLAPRFLPADDWVLVGHSLGCPTILRLLETFSDGEKARAVILVAGFADDLGIPQISNFVDKPFNWEKIRTKAGRFIVINSDNDPFIDLSEGERVAKLLGAEFIVEHGAGHINEGAGFTKYERLLKILKNLRAGASSRSQ
jgi:predicted alpha/beta hydrolase family esterase